MAGQLSAADSTIIRKDNPETLYEILVEVGQGSFGSVYKARDRKTGAAVAIKQMKKTEEDDEWEDMLREIRCLSLLDHENIVKHLATYLRGGTLWMIMEFCIGSAADIIDLFKKPFAEAEIAAIMQSVTSALAYLHQTKRIHRDLKAANILLNSRGQVKLGDFGSASVSEPANTFVGTPCWMAPEVILAMETGVYNTSADIWGLAITAIELAEKKPPLFEMNTMSALYHIPQNDPPNLAEPTLWSSEFNDFVTHCLKKQPEERPTASGLLMHPFLVGKDPSVHAKTLKALVRKSKAAALARDQEVPRKIDEILSSDGSAPSTPRPDQGHERFASDVSDGDSVDAGGAKTPNDVRRRKFSAMLEIDLEDDLSEAVKDFHLRDESGQESVDLDAQTIKPQRRDTEAEADRRNDRDFVRGQLKALQRLQARHQKQIKAMQKAHEQQLQEAHKTADKQAEVEGKLNTAETAKAVAKQKVVMADHQKMQKQEMKTFLSTQAKDAKARQNEHEASLKKGLKELEKAQKQEKEAAAKDTHRGLKERFANDLKAYKTETEAAFKSREAEISASNLLAFKRKQVDDAHALELRLFNEHLTFLEAQKEANRKRRIAQQDAEATLIMAQAEERWAKATIHQTEVLKVEMEQLDLQQKQEEKELRKRHLAEIKAHPKQLKSIKNSVKREYTDTMRTNKQKHDSLERQILGSTPKEDRKRMREIQRLEFEREMTKTSAEFERKLSESLERESLDLEAQHQRQEENLKSKQARDRQGLIDLQTVRKATMETSHAREREELRQILSEKRSQLERYIAVEMQQFHDTWAQSRREMEERQTAEKARVT